jgi:hypothetical protein
MRHVCLLSRHSAKLPKKQRSNMSSENLTDQFASAVMTGSINEADITRAGANGACDATRIAKPGGESIIDWIFVVKRISREWITDGCARDTGD